MEKYKYDIHVHTSETSHCGHVPAITMVDEYIANGYSGIVFTDHLHQDFVDSLPKNSDWNFIVDAFMSGYHSAKAHADTLDKEFDVIFGAELRFSANDNDYLVFGIDEAFLKNNPFIHHLQLDTFYEKFKDEVVIIHAHPFRGGGVGIFPEYLHGVEIINCNERHDSGNPKAIALTEKHPHLIRTSASDAHRPEDIARGAILTDKRIHDSFELKDLLLHGGYELYSPEFAVLISSAGAYEEIR